MKEDRIKDELKILGSSLGDIPPLPRQEVPNGYFDTLADRVMLDVRLKEEEERLERKEYFDQLTDQVVKQVKPVKTLKLPYILGIASSIALLIMALGYFTIPTPSSQEYTFKTDFSEDELLFALEEYYTLEEIAYLDEDQEPLDIIDEESDVYLDYLEDYDIDELDIELD